MKTLPRLAIAFCLTLAAPLSLAQGEWITLIDGTEGLDNFTVVGDANWQAAMSSIMATEGDGASFLVTPDSYGDFQLRVEFWASEDANSGIYLRCQNPMRITDRNCYEANIFDQRPDATYATGGVVHIAPVPNPRPLAGDHWNVYEITMQGSRMIVELNGEVTAVAHDDQFSSGPFALQWARGVIRFRKVQVREL